MSISKTTAVVLKKLRLNEADNILTLLTNDGSKISAVAKGVRKTKSKFAGRLEPFSIVDLVLYKGKTLYTITQVNTVRDNLKLRDYECFVAASALGELVSRVTFEKGNDGEIFELFIESLKLIEKVENKKSLIVVFDWKVMQALGYLPNLKNICDCNGSLYLDLSGEGIVCRNCRKPEKQYFPIDTSSVKKLDQILSAEMASTTANKDDYQCLSKITEHYLEYQLELKLRSRNIL